jgi:Flp pilus assembly protein protease CpaA
MLTHSMTASAVLSAVLIVVLVLAVWFDVSEHRIPNWITAGGLVGALALRGILGFDALQSGVLGGAVGFSLGILLFAAGVMGAGDGKFLATVGSFLGLRPFLLALPLIGAFGGVLALAVIIRKGTVIATFRRFRELLFYFVTFGRIGERRTLSMPGAVTIPYGVAVAAGAAMAWLGRGVIS